MSISLRKIIHFRAALSTMKGLMFGMIFSWWVTPAQGQEIQAYAKPKEDYTYIYTLDHKYETTLFRSEKFDPIEETEEGYVILLQLAGNPKLVLLPFEGRDRKIAEKKYRGVGVTYTAFMTFTEGYLPFTADQYYEVVKREKGMLLIDYSLKGFRKVIEVPESEFIVKSAFEFNLEQSLEELRQSYKTFGVTESHPSSWNQANTTAVPGTLTESPTHIALVRNQVLANNFQSIRTAPASQLSGVLSEVWVDKHRLLVVPIQFTHESDLGIHYFVKMKGYSRPVLLKNFKVPEGMDGYSKVVRIATKSGQDERYLEVTESLNIEFYPNFHFLSPGDMIATRKTYSGHQLIASDGAYAISEDDIELFTPKAFLQTWASRTVKNNLNPDDKLFRELLEFKIPPVTGTASEWRSLQMLQTLAKLNSQIRTSEKASVRYLTRALEKLESGANYLGLTLHTNPKNTLHPSLNQSFYSYWKTAFTLINSQAARDRDQDTLRRQILRSKVMISETQHQALIDFLSAQIYTYSNYLPAPLNRINQLETDQPLGASELMVFNFPLDQSFKLNPVTLESLELQNSGSTLESFFLINEKYNPSWLLDIDALQYWQAMIYAKMEEVYDPAFWIARNEKETAEKQKRLEIARQRLLEAKTAAQEQPGLMNDPEAPWIASGIWLVVILMTNTGFLALSKAMPLRQS